MKLGTVGAAIVGAAIAFASPKPAVAAPCPQAYVWNTGDVITAALLNANPQRFVQCFNNLDNTNIGPLGIYASQVIPLTVAQATFGGAQAYRFNAALTVGTRLTVGNEIDLGVSTLTTSDGGLQLTGQNAIGTTTAFRVTGNRATLTLQATGTGGDVWSVISGDAVGTVPGSLAFQNSTTNVTDAFNDRGALGIDGNQAPVSPANGLLGGTSSSPFNLLSWGATAAAYAFTFQPRAGTAIPIVAFKNAAGTVVATISNTGVYAQTSVRWIKTDIAPLQIDALATLHKTCWSRYRLKGANESQIGFIADCAPAVLSGPKRNHFDGGAVATVDAVAILQLDKRLRALERENLQLRTRVALDEQELIHLGPANARQH